MDSKALIKIELNKEITLDEQINLSFQITKLAAKNKIGTNFGGNIAQSFSHRLKNLKKNEILFELTDDPMDIDATELFMGAGFPDYSKRMQNIQIFLKTLFLDKIIFKLTLDINPYATEVETIEFKVPIINIKVNDFCSKIFELQEKIFHQAPQVRFIINR